MRTYPVVILGLAIAAAAAAATSAWATSFVEVPFPEAVDDAPVIVRGKVGNSYPDWGNAIDGSRKIYTFYELVVDEVLKGQAAKGRRSILMRELGGEKDGIGMQVSGTAHFERGEDVVVFLGPTATDGVFDVRGMMMAKYNVRRDADGADVLEGPGVTPLTGHLTGQGDTRVRKKWTLDDLRHVIDEQARARPSEAKTPAATPSKTAAAPSPGAPQAPSERQAPQLQPADTEAPGPSPEDAKSPWRWLAGLVAVALAGYGLARRRGRK